ncbi:YbjN domain-containing protein [Bosea sp. BH3]|uniref:YbjN domain-containing protein n=1 Tax=Bosea sp. BH3 TaxID=2871701 RepID=UPI000DDA6A17|nr:YbjN domain-containing protein [Bosea sp. BH3]MCU4180987.1 YbjN domain-containing protein [Bosea sp. BH3]
MMDLDMDADQDRPSNPLDLFERLASLNDWTFDRDSEDELSVAVTGGWSDYHVAITWLAEVEALHIACAFDLKVPERRRGEVLQLVSLVNEQLWLGHFDLWSSESVVMYRHALLLSGGAEPTEEQAAALVRSAVEACERYYQAFQFVVWAGKTAKEGMEGAILETAGEA